MKRTVTLWMALLCLFSLVLGASATETQPETAPVRAPGQCGENVYWNLAEDGTLTISGSGPMDDFEEAPWAELREEIYALVVGEEITYIGAHAFEDLDELVEVTLGKAVTELGSSAFRSCDKLWELSLPRGFRILGEDSLRSCALMHEIRFDGGMPKFKLNCLWDTTARLVYPAGNPWPLEHIMQLEEAFQGRIEFLSSDGTDPYITELDEAEATAPATEPEETRPTRPYPTEAPAEAPTTAPTEAVTVPTIPTQATRSPETQVETTVATTVETTVETDPEESAPATTGPEPTRRSEGGGIGLAIVLGTLSLLMLGALIFGGKRNRGGKYSR